MTEKPKYEPQAEDVSKSISIYSAKTSNPAQVEVTWTDWTKPSRNCPECLYYDAIPGTDSGICHRFPKEEVVDSDYWCGEFVRTRMETK